MYSLKTTAVVLRRKSFGEADILLTLLTPDRGKLKVVAKGARRVTSRLVGHTELFSVISGQVNFKTSLPILSQVTVEASVEGLATNPELIQQLSLLAEVVDKALEEDTAQPLVFDVIVEGYQRLRAQSNPLLFAGILLRLLGIFGYAPELGHCVICKQKLAAGGRYGWHHAEGGIVADECLDRHRDAYILDEESLKALRHLQRQSLETMGRLQSSGAVSRDLHDVLVNYTRYVLEQPLLSTAVSYA